MMLHLQNNNSDIIYIMIDSFVSLKFVCFVGACKKIAEGVGGGGSNTQRVGHFLQRFKPILRLDSYESRKVF